LTAVATSFSYWSWKVKEAPVQLLTCGTTPGKFKGQDNGPLYFPVKGRARHDVGIDSTTTLLDQANNLIYWPASQQTVGECNLTHDKKSEIKVSDDGYEAAAVLPGSGGESSTLYFLDAGQKRLVAYGPPVATEDGGLSRKQVSPTFHSVPFFEKAKDQTFGLEVSPVTVDGAADRLLTVLIWSSAEKKTQLHMALLSKSASGKTMDVPDGHIPLTLDVDPERKFAWASTYQKSAGQAWVLRYPLNTTSSASDYTSFRVDSEPPPDLTFQTDADGKLWAVRAGHTGLQLLPAHENATSLEPVPVPGPKAALASRAYGITAGDGHTVWTVCEEDGAAPQDDLAPWTLAEWDIQKRLFVQRAGIEVPKGGTCDYLDFF
jgi:hypothetical protein